MTDQSERSLSSREVQAALDTLLSYLVQQVRQRDGVLAPPLLDRNDLLAYVEVALWAPLTKTDERPGLEWLAERLRQYGAQLPSEPPALKD